MHNRLFKRRESITTGACMRAKFYSDELKSEAVRLVIERRLTAGEAAARLNIQSDAVRVWVRRFRSGKRAMAPPEIRRLKTELLEASVERDVLLKLATRLLAKTG
ncbi:hypothetical protein B0E48_00765 [Rhodanobacter sp. C03]|nr:hypothetical protein B0E48_00765 [Rhodanobacter sp. C03]